MDLKIEIQSRTPACQADTWVQHWDSWFSVKFDMGLILESFLVLETKAHIQAPHNSMLCVNLLTHRFPKESFANLHLAINSQLLQLQNTSLLS